MKQRFTSGEKRGMIALLIIITLLVGCVYFMPMCSRTSSSITTITTEISTVSQKQTTDSAQSTKRKKREKQAVKRSVAPIRNPLSQPVPYNKKNNYDFR